MFFFQTVFDGAARQPREGLDRGRVDQVVDARGTQARPPQDAPNVCSLPLERQKVYHTSHAMLVTSQRLYHESYHELKHITINAGLIVFSVSRTIYKRCTAGKLSNFLNVLLTIRMYSRNRL